MFRYIVKRLLLLLLVILGVSFMIYFIMDLAPGDPVRSILGDFATEEEYQQLKVELGYDKPMIVRYGKYMLGMLQGDMGYSNRYKMDVMEMYLQRIPATIFLAISSHSSYPWYSALLLLCGEVLSWIMAFPHLP